MYEQGKQVPESADGRNLCQWLADKTKTRVVEKDKTRVQLVGVHDAYKYIQSILDMGPEQCQSEDKASN
jgi:hypothetical protein